MTILQRYIAKTLMTYTALVVLIVIGLSFFIQIVTELRDIGSGDYGLGQALVFTFLRLPYNLYQFSPMLILLGGIVGLGLLASQQELMVMRTSGVSVRSLMKSVAITATILIVIATLFGELFAPQANYEASKFKDSAQNGGQAIATASGVWIHEGNNFLHIDRVVGHRHLEGVTRYEFDATHHLLASYFASIMDFKDGKWQVQDGVKTTFQNDQTSSQEMVTGTWEGLTLNPNLLNVGVVEPEEMSLPKLAKYSNHLTKNGLQATQFQFEFWKRIFQPLASLVMMLLAVPFVLSAPRSVTMGWRMLLGVMIGFTFYILNAFLGQLSVVYQLSPLIAAIFPTLLFIVLGYVFMSTSNTLSR
jgi:lipopolysaccharide export system permease protein